MSDNQMGSRWIRCPICGGKTRTKIFADTVLINFPLYCPRCRKEITIDDLLVGGEYLRRIPLVYIITDNRVQCQPKCGKEQRRAKADNAFFDSPLFDEANLEP